MRAPHRLAAAALAALLLAGCEEADSKFPTTGSFFASVTATNAVTSDTSRSPAPREFRFRIGSFVADFGDGTPWSFIGKDRAPCDYAFSVFSLFDAVPATQLTRACGGGGVVREANEAGCFRLFLDLESITAVYAERPDLSTGLDFDGDGVPNESDNCPIQYNPRVPIDPLDPSAGSWQPDVNGDGIGDACSFPVEGSPDPVVPDQDLDGVSDGVDNCAWYPNPDQTDANRNGIGDACERILPVFLTGGSSFSCPAPGVSAEVCAGREPFGYEGEAYTIAESSIVFYAIDFSEAIRCDEVFTACELDPSKVRLVPRTGIDPASIVLEESRPSEDFYCGL